MNNTPLDPSNTNSNTQLYLVDGSSLLFRAFYAITHLTNKEGFPTNAIYGFAMMILKMMERFSPTHIAVIWDTSKPTVRHEYYAEYKANRSAMPEDLGQQIAPIHQFLEILGIHQMRLEGYEADDIIGTLCHQHNTGAWPAFKPQQVVIVSPDKDLFQLIKPDIIIYDGMKEKFQAASDCLEKFGINPEQMIDFLALTGDSSDNIPGVKGIGPKTASELLKTYGTLESLYQNINQLPESKRKNMLLEGQEKAFLSRRLATVILEAPIEIDPQQFVPNPTNWEALGQFCGQYQLKAVLQKATQLSQTAAKPAETAVHSTATTQAVLATDAPTNKETTTPQHSPSEFILNAQIITQLTDLQSLIKEIEQAKRFVFDLETTSLNPFEAQIVGIAIAVNPQKGFYIPLLAPELESHLLLKPATVWHSLSSVFQNPHITKLGHNLKFDLSMLHCHNIAYSGPFEDSMLMSYILNPEGRHGMDALSLQMLNHETITFDQLLSGAKDPSTLPKKKWRTITEVPLAEITQYAGEDAQVTFALIENLTQQLTAQNLLQFYHEIELPTMPTLLSLELKGVMLNKAHFAELSAKYAAEIAEVESKVTELAGITVNLRSPKQLENLLFEKLDLPKQRKTKTGYSTDVDVLEKLARLHPVPQLILEHRELSKLKSTYLDTLPELVEPSTNRVHTHYHQTVAATGRLSSQNPNLQNIPIKTMRGKAIRYGFIAPPGFQFVGADYSQIELRILAHFCEDEKLLEAFAQGQDIHRKTASQVFFKPMDQITDQERTFAKTINFGIIYGQTPYGLSQQLNISQAEARSFITQYFASFPKIQNCMDQFVLQAQTHGYVQTLLGRKRWIKDINSQNRMIKEAAQRVAINTPIQGTAADLIKIAMNQLHAQLQKNFPNAHLILQVHDELVCEVPTEQTAAVEQLMRQTMEQVIALKVPLTVDTAIANNWGDL